MVPLGLMKPLPNHIEELIHPSALLTDCWEWGGVTRPDGYGQILVSGKLLKAHRVVYESLVGPIPHGLDLLHSCDNPSCVNPQHLSPGTHADNMRDKAVRGRSNSTLTHEEVRAIRRSTESPQKIGLLYGTSKSNVCKIRRGTNQKHVPN